MEEILGAVISAMLGAFGWWIVERRKSGKDLQNAIMQLENWKNETTKAISNIDNRNCNYDLDRKEHTKKITELETTVENIDDRLKGVEAKVGDMNKTFARIAGIENIIKDMNQNFMANHEVIRELSTNIGKIEGKQGTFEIVLTEVKDLLKNKRN